MTRERATRCHDLLVAALTALESQRLPAGDAWFYEALRETLVAAGATDDEIDGVAWSYVVAIVKGPPDAEVWDAQLDLIAEHLACTRLHLSVNPADLVIRVDFLDRPTTH